MRAMNFIEPTVAYYFPSKEAAQAFQAWAKKHARITGRATLRKALREKRRGRTTYVDCCFPETGYGVWVKAWSLGDAMELAEKAREMGRIAAPFETN